MAVIMTQSAVSSVAAALSSNPGERSAAELEYDAVVASCVPKPGGHVHPLLEDARLYSVTTIASSQRFGGTRTVAVCDSFDGAKDIVERNVCDIWEYSYMLCVVEEIKPNSVYGGLGRRSQYWWRWEGGKDGGYAPVETPEAYRNTSGFGIG